MTRSPDWDPTRESALDYLRRIRDIRVTAKGRELLRLVDEEGLTPDEASERLRDWTADGPPA